jgi:hypothetical protein
MSASALIEPTEPEVRAFMRLCEAMLQRFLGISVCDTYLGSLASCKAHMQAGDELYGVVNDYASKFDLLRLDKEGPYGAQVWIDITEADQAEVINDLSREPYALSMDAFQRQFRPIKNKLCAAGQRAFDDCLFESTGSELSFILKARQSNPSRLWTVDEVNGCLRITNGYRAANSIGYLITGFDAPKGVSYEVIDAGSAQRQAQPAKWHFSHA